MMYNGWNIHSYTIIASFLTAPYVTKYMIIQNNIIVSAYDDITVLYWTHNQFIYTFCANYIW